VPPLALKTLNPDHWQWARRNERINVLAYGTVGTGKSSLCRYLLCRDIIKDRTVYDVCATEIEQWRFSPWDHKEKLIAAKGRDTVLIDDVDNANFSLAGLNVLREILDARHEQKKRTLVTCNCNPSELKARFTKVYGSDDAAQSLLERLRPYHAMKCVGESFRKSL
jgi:DNA replication protein DnaC